MKRKQINDIVMKNVIFTSILLLAIGTSCYVEKTYDYGINIERTFLNGTLSLGDDLNDALLDSIERNGGGQHRGLEYDSIVFDLDKNSKISGITFVKRYDKLDTLLMVKNNIIKDYKYPESAFSKDSAMIYIWSDGITEAMLKYSSKKKKFIFLTYKNTANI